MNTTIQIIFGVLGVILLGSALMVVLTRHVLHAAAWLGSSFAAAAALFFLLEAPFVGIVQGLVSLVAVTTLFVLAIRLTRHDPVEATRQVIARWWLVAAGAVVLFALVLVPVLFRPGLPNGGTWPRTDLGSADPAQTGAGIGGAVAGAAEIGQSLMSEYVVPFEVVAILLLVGVVGAVILMQRDPDVAATVRRRRARIYHIE